MIAIPSGIFLMWENVIPLKVYEPTAVQYRPIIQIGHCFPTTHEGTSYVHRESAAGLRRLAKVPGRHPSARRTRRSLAARHRPEPLADQGRGLERAWPLNRIGQLAKS